MTESYENGDRQGFFEDTEHTDLFESGSSSGEEQPQAGPSRADIDPNLIDPALQSLVLQNITTNQAGSSTGSRQQSQNSQDRPAPENSGPSASTPQRRGNAQIYHTSPGGPPHQQWVNSQNAALASGNPGPPPDQIAMDAIMTNTSFPGHAPTGYQPRTGWEGNSSYPSTRYGTNVRHERGNNMYGGGPPSPRYNPPDVPYGADAGPTAGFQPPIDPRTLVGTDGPNQPSAGPPLQPATGLIPDRFPTQHRYGIPGLDYLPPKYTWSNARCNNCDHLRKACGLFPKILRTDMTQTLIKFPCPQCAPNDVKAASCTWSIMKSANAEGSGDRLYWNGAQVVSDPIERNNSTGSYATYKKYQFLESLVPSPWPPHTGPSNQPGVYETHTQREAIRKNALLQPPAGAAYLQRVAPPQGAALPVASPPRDQSGRIGKLPSKSVKKVKPYGNTKKKRTCIPCNNAGTYLASVCDIESGIPCRRCKINPQISQNDCREFHADVDEEDDSDSGVASVSNSLGEELNRTIPPRRPGRIVHPLASGMSKRSRISPNAKSTTPNGKKKSTGKGMAGSGGMQRPASDSSMSPIVRGSQHATPTAGSMLQNFSPGELGDDEYTECEPTGNSCVFCRNNGWRCDGERPCGNCAMEFNECAYLDQQAFPRAQSSPPAWAAGTFGYAPRHGPPNSGEGGSTQNASPGAATQALADLLVPGTGLDIAVPEQNEPREHPGVYSADDWMQGLLQEGPKQDLGPEQDQRAGNSQQESIFDQLGINPYQAVRNDQNHPPPGPESGFQEVRDQNAAQQQYEANIPLDERAANALVQNHHVEGGSPLEVVEAFIQPIGIVMHNVDDQAIRERRDPSLPPLSGAVLPQVGVPQNRAYIGPEAFEDVDGCHESNGFNQRCGYHPTKPCSVYGHSMYCVCTSCRETQDRYANAGSPENPSQQEVIDATKGAYCGACAQDTKKELEQGNIDIRINSCLCTGQLTKAWMCSVHRQQAKMLVRRRTLLMRDWTARKFVGPFGRYLPCARCSVNIPDVNSGVWECVACCEKVVQAKF